MLNVNIFNFTDVRQIYVKKPQNVVAHVTQWFDEFSIVVTFKMSVLKMAPVVPDRARRSRYGGWREFLFHCFNPSTRTCTHTLRRARTRVSTKDPGAFHFADTRPSSN